MLEWPLRVALVLGGLMLATPGGGIMPLSNTTMELTAAAILVPTVLVALLLVRRTRAAYAWQAIEKVEVMANKRNKRNKRNK